MAEEIYKGKPTTPEDKSWLAHSWKNKQEEPSRLEDAAKFLSGMISISLTIFLKIDKDGFDTIGQLGGTKVIVVTWLLSLFFSFLVLYPFHYSYAADSAQSIKEMHQKIVRTKQWLLIVSILLFLFSLIGLATFFLQNLG